MVNTNTPGMVTERLIFFRRPVDPGFWAVCRYNRSDAAHTPSLLSRFKRRRGARVAKGPETNDEVRAADLPIL